MHCLRVCDKIELKLINLATKTGWKLEFLEVNQASLYLWKVNNKGLIILCRWVGWSEPDYIVQVGRLV